MLAAMVHQYSYKCLRMAMVIKLTLLERVNGLWCDQLVLSVKIKIALAGRASVELIEKGSCQALESWETFQDRHRPAAPF